MGLAQFSDLSFGQCFWLWIGTTLVVVLAAGSCGLVLERHVLDDGARSELRLGLLIQSAYLISSSVFAVWLPLARIHNDSALNEISWAPAMAVGGLVGVLAAAVIVPGPEQEHLLLRFQREAVRRSRSWLVPVSAVPFFAAMGLVALSESSGDTVEGQYILIAAFGGLAHAYTVGQGVRSLDAWRSLLQIRPGTEQR